MTNTEMREVIGSYAKCFKTSSIIANGEGCARYALEDSVVDSKEEIRKVIAELGVRALGEELTKVGLAKLAKSLDGTEEQ